MKTIIINSYYSECKDVPDGLYQVTFDDEKYSIHIIKKMIENTYRKMNEDESGDFPMPDNLSEVLEVLHKENKTISWECTQAIKFDCNYGEFDK